jgi:hypothetical protein
MKKANAVLLIGLVSGAVLVIDAQTEPPKNLAGVDFPCTYNKPITHNITAKFFETINDATFATNFQIESGNMILRAETAVCQPSGECELRGKVTVNLTASKPAGK